VQQYDRLKTLTAIAMAVKCIIGQAPGTTAHTALLPSVADTREIPALDDVGKCRQGDDRYQRQPA